MLAVVSSAAICYGGPIVHGHQRAEIYKGKRVVEFDGGYSFNVTEPHPDKFIIQVYKITFGGEVPLFSAPVKIETSPKTQAAPMTTYFTQIGSDSNMKATLTLQQDGTDYLDLVLPDKKGRPEKHKIELALEFDQKFYTDVFVTQSRKFPEPQVMVKAKAIRRG